MKKTILTLAITGIIVGSGLTAVGQEDKKSKKARKNEVEAQKDIREAKTDSAADFQKFKKEAETTIAENQTKIAELKAKKASDKKEDNEKYNKKVLALEKKNNVLKNKIEACDNTKTSMWPAFKREFKHDADELGHAFKDIAVDNTK